MFFVHPVRIHASVTVMCPAMLQFGHVNHQRKVHFFCTKSCDTYLFYLHVWFDIGKTQKVLCNSNNPAMRDRCCFAAVPLCGKRTHLQVRFALLRTSPVGLHCEVFHFSIQEPFFPQICGKCFALYVCDVALYLLEFLYFFAFQRSSR